MLAINPMQKIKLVFEPDYIFNAATNCKLEKKIFNENFVCLPSTRACFVVNNLN